MAVDVERVKAAHPIADVVAAHGVRLRPAGRRFIALCPFHTDTRPSFVVYPDTRSFHCFACGATGDVIDFVRRVRELGFVDALRYLGEAPAPSTPGEPGASTSPPAARPLSLDDRLLLTAACELYHETLLRTPRALGYLDDRRIPRWLVRRARLGYSDGQVLEPYLRRRRLSIRRAVEVGLLYADATRPGALREAMRDRLVIPDLRPGHCAWMTGRALAADAKLPYLDLALPKPLLGYEWIRGRERVIVTEGPFDWLSALAWGLPACALLGTHPGARPLRLLGRIPSLLLVLDNDTAGVPAAESLSHAIGDRARVLRLPDRIKDLNELARQEDGRERFLELIADAEDGGADVPVVA